MSNKSEERIAEVRDRLKILEASLPEQIDPIGISRTKLPSKVLGYREALIWRVTELVRAALQMLDSEQFAAAVVLTRAAAETSAALWYLDEKVEMAVTSNKLGDLDDCVVRLLCGTYKWEDFPDPIRVGKFVDRVERRLPGFKEQYSRLSEYAHPNGAGTIRLYSTIDRENIFVNFGLEDRNTQPARAISAANLSVALMIFELKYNHLSDVMSDFVKLCEREIPPL